MNKFFLALVAINFASVRSEEHTSELQSLAYLVCRLLLEKNKPVDLPTQPRGVNSATDMAAPCVSHTQTPCQSSRVAVRPARAGLLSPVRSIFLIEGAPRRTHAFPPPAPFRF